MNHEVDEVEDGGKHWFVGGTDPPTISEENLATVDKIYRDRLRTLLSVDDLVDELMTRLDEEGLLV